MYVPVRRFFGTTLGVLTLLGPFCANGQAQFNPYVNPMAGAGGFLSGGVFASPFGVSAGLGYGANAGAGFGAPFGMGHAGLGYANLMAVGGYGAMGANALLGNSAIAGGGYGYGFGYGFGLANTQWMMNPYQGMLQGAADTTRANAQYWQGIQQARQTRQEVIRSSLETRRAMIEEAEWERAHMPDPEKIRQRTLERALNRARSTPPSNDIWSARALNTLLRHLVTQQADGAKGPRVPLSENTINHLNVKVGDSVGHVGLLKNSGELDWPEALQGGAFKESREQINALMRRAYKSVASGNNPDAPTLGDLEAQYRKMRQLVDNSLEKPNEYVEAKRFMEVVDKTIKGLEDPNVGHLNEDWKPKAKDIKDVAALVKHMREKGLMLAPATDGDEAAYTALYHALATFDAGMTRVARGNADAPEK